RVLLAGAQELLYMPHIQLESRAFDFGERYDDVVFELPCGADAEALGIVGKALVERKQDRDVVGRILQLLGRKNRRAPVGKLLCLIERDAQISLDDRAELEMPFLLLALIIQSFIAFDEDGTREEIDRTLDRHSEVVDDALDV